MHHKYVDPRRRGGLDRLDELDGRLVDAAGERDRRRRVARRSRRRSSATSSSCRRGRRRRDRPRRRPSGTTASARGSRRGTARISRTGSRSAIGRARRRVRICSPVLTTPPVLGALASVVAAGRVDVAGCLDGTQIRGRRPPVAREQRPLEAAAARADRGPVLGEGVDALRHGRRPRLHAREDHGRATTPSSSAPSISRARASGTPRTCSRSRTPRSRSRWPRSSTVSAPATRRSSSDSPPGGGRSRPPDRRMRRCGARRSPSGATAARARAVRRPRR